MRFLIDADLPRETASLLASYGHVGIDIRDIGMRRADDSEVAAYALKNGLCLVTGDWGFSDIRIYPPERYSGIVVIGLPAHSTGKLMLSILRSLLDAAELVAMLPGRLAIIEKNRLRLRPPP
jgi:predicted nuclease of predicted toxin-antitoxin system